MKRFYLFLSLLLAVLGLHAQTISMTTSNGTLSGSTWTSNAASGVAGVTVSTTNASAMEATSDGYYYLTPKSNTTAYVYTITAPSGYVVAGYSATFTHPRTGNSYWVYWNKSSKAPTASSYDARANKNTPATVSVTGNTTATLQFSVKNGQSNATQRLQVTAFTITLEKEVSAEIEWSAAEAEESTDNASHSFPTLSNPHGLTVTYASSDETAATINAYTGEISLVGPGTTDITAAWESQTAGGVEYPAGSASYTLTVTGSYVPTLEWSAAAARVRAGSTSGFPTLTNPIGLTVTYESSRPGVATIDASGNITALASGVTVIKASTADQTVGGKPYRSVTATYELTVVNVSDPTMAESTSGSFYPTLDTWNYLKILDLFYQANKAGRYYPTDAEWEAAGFNVDDIAFVRSHVGKRQRISATAADHNIGDASYWKSDRQFYAHFSTNSGYGTLGYPSVSQSDENFSMWNYVDLFDNFNHSIGHVSGAWTDAAHKNGTSLLGGGLLLESPDQHTSYVEGIRAKDDTEPSGFKYVRAIVSMLMYFGQDGYHITSWMTWGSDSEDSDDQRAYMKAIYDLAAERGYTGNLRMGMQAMSNTYTSENNYAEWGTKGDGYISDIALHWTGNSQVFSSSAADAQAAFANQVGEEYGNRLFATGNFSSWAQPWNIFQNNNVGIALWGERAANRFWSNSSGNDAISLSENYILLQERGFSGGNRNPNSTPAVYVGDEGGNWGNDLDGFHGIASFMPEHSTVVGNLPFLTNFQIGNGVRYHYKGKQTGGEWYNMANQDVVPTYRWLVVNDAAAGTKVTNTSIVPRFSYDDAYNGGTCLKITGTGSTAGDVVLYKSQLTAGANPIAKIAVKTPAGAGATNLQIKLQVDGAWKTFDVGATNGATWQEKTISLAGVSAGSVIENIALRLTSVSADTKLYVGMLEINDDTRKAPAAIKDAQVKIFNEKATNITVKAWWNVEGADNQYGRDLNEDLDIDHFEVLFKPYDKGDVVEVARTSQWATIAPSIIVSENDDPWIGIRSVSTDLKTYSDIEWVHVGHSLDATGSDYGDSYSYPILSSYGNGGEETQKTFFKMTAAWTENASVQDLDYDITSKDPDPYVGRSGAPALVPAVGNSILIDIASYDYADELCIKVNPGDAVDFHFTHNDYMTTGSLSYDLLSVFADWYGVGSFVDNPIFSVTTKMQKQLDHPYYVSGDETTSCERMFTFNVPADAKPGKSRLRLVFNDAWSPQPGATSPLTKGVAFDFPIEVMDLGQVAGTSEAVQGKDEGAAAQPAGLPGSALSTWGDLQDGGVYYLTSDDGHGKIRFYKNNDGTLDFSAGVEKDDRADFMEDADYSYAFVAHKTSSNKFVFANGHGGYFEVSNLESDYNGDVFVSDANGIVANAEPAMTMAAGTQSASIQVRSAKYPNEVVVRPTTCANFDGETENIALATWSAPFETILPEGLKAYTIEGAFDKNDLSYAAIVPVEATQGGVDIIPANVGVLLVSTGVAVPESGLKFFMAPAASSGAADPSAVNYLNAFTTKDFDKGTNHLTAGGKYYILAATDGTAATRKLYQVNTAKAENLIPNPNKAVLDANSLSLSAPGLRLVWDTTKTSVGKVVIADDVNAPTYDLQGRRVNNSQKGIVIRNGKKIVKF